MKQSLEGNQIAMDLEPIQLGAHDTRGLPFAHGDLLSRNGCGRAEACDADSDQRSEAFAIDFDRDPRAFDAGQRVQKQFRRFRCGQADRGKIDFGCVVGATEKPRQHCLEAMLVLYP